MLFFVNAPCVICFIILLLSIVKIIIIHVKTFLLAAFYHCIYNHRTTKTNQKYPSVNL